MEERSAFCGPEGPRAKELGIVKAEATDLQMCWRDMPEWAFHLLGLPCAHPRYSPPHFRSPSAYDPEQGRRRIVDLFRCHFRKQG
jgi:hypothetical protein